VENRNINPNHGLEFEEICFMLDQLKASGVNEFIFSGGGPFIREDIHEICRYVKEEAKIANLHVITNGSMNYKKYIEAFEYIDVLNISIDGYNEETQFIRDKGIMPKIIKNITFLREKVPVNLIATIHAKNVQFIEDYIKLSKDLGVQLSFSIFTVDPNDETFKDYIFDNSSLLEFSNKILSLDQNIPIFDTPVGKIALTCKGNCEVGKEIISIGADGTIYPCHMLHDVSLELGNLLHDWVCQ
jgi:MoaA/NifB/PqqE/SkfB family radical SAM enzyme